MDIHHTSRLGIGHMDAGLDMEGKLAPFALAAQHIPREVADDEVARAQFLEQEAAGVDQEKRFGPCQRL
jgi:hypothetical protein